MTAAALNPVPIAGVSPDHETVLEYVFPGVASNPLGRWIGGILGSLMAISPLPVRLALLVLVGGLLAPLGLLLYFWIKVQGTYFAVTNRGVQERGAMSGTVVRVLKLTEVGQITIGMQDGYEFHRVGDVRLQSANGDTLLTIPAVAYPERLVRVLTEVRDAHRHTADSLQQIQARK